MNPAALVGLERVSRRYHGVRALSEVSLDLLPGETHALVGANGAGKSTLVNLLVGLQQPDHGTIRVLGSPIVITGPAAARALGIDAVFQETHLPPNLTVAESMFLGREPRRLGFIDSVTLDRRAREVLDRLASEIDTETLVERLSVAHKQIVQIARALTGQPRLLILDEPTSALTDHEISRLLALLEGLRTQGVAQLFVSHKLEEVERLADRVTVLRDGRNVGSLVRGEVSASRLVSLMAAPDLGADADTGAESGLETGGAPRVQGSGLGLPVSLNPEHSTNSPEPAEPLLQVRGLTTTRRYSDISFDVLAGEVLGIFGIVGAGRTEVARAVFGLDRFDSGEVVIAGCPIELRSPADAVRAGIGLVPEDRKQHGLVMGMSLLRNLTLAALPRLATAGVISSSEEERLSRQMIDELQVVCSSLQQEAQSLSGGNQQKVVIGKWLAARPRILILDEPTRGIDVAAKAEVHTLIRRLASEGLGVLLISSELGEVLHVSDRVLVMRAGRIAGELNPRTASHSDAISMATG